MKRFKVSKNLSRLAAGLVPAGYLAVVRFGSQGSFPGWMILFLWGLTYFCFLGAAKIAAHLKEHPFWTLHGWWTIPGISVMLGGIILTTQNASIAWLGIFCWFTLLLCVSILLRGQPGRVWKWLPAIVLAALAGLGPVAQVGHNFSDEEFFAAVQGLVLAGYFLLLVVLSNAVDPPERETAPHQPKGASLVRLGIVTILLLGAGGGGLLNSYQASFYPETAPGYPGISPENPFLCGTAMADPKVYSGEQVFQALLNQVEQNAYKGPPELGMLALGTMDPQWAGEFREALLAEAEQGKFTTPANSVKSSQLEAAGRAYYYTRMKAAFPNLFSAEEMERLQAWFGEVNRRATTVEWIDWLYAAAFDKPPLGPYENQENGAGLLSLLEAFSLSQENLSPDNQAYLLDNPRGWEARFRNTDDVYRYQADWITNAYFQSLYTGDAPQENLGLSFRWLLLQATPSGVPINYNHPYALSNAGPAYFGAALLEDPELLWLAGRALEPEAVADQIIFAQPGAETTLTGEGVSPTAGSCLLYGDSGLPNQTGPLAPDKLVFRDGWTPDALYALVNLRYSGWHRYKATNTITAISQAGPLVVELQNASPYRWLPTGRSLFRDKRIPRENLNGLQIPLSGLSDVLFQLTGINGPWAQDPPYYAEVVDFTTTQGADHTTILIQDWHGWRHQRDIHFYHQGPMIIVDQATGPSRQAAALTWHVSAPDQPHGVRFPIGGPDNSAEMVLVGTPPAAVLSTSLSAENEAAGPWRIMVRGNPTGSLSVITVLLTGDWSGAGVTRVAEESGAWLIVEKGAETLRIPLPAGLEIDQTSPK